MIKITYQRTLADFVNFNIYHVWKSPDRKYFRLLIHYGVPTIVTLLVLLATLLAGIPVTFDNSKGMIVAFIALVIIMYIAGGRLITSSIQKKIANNLTPAAINHLTGNAEITLTPQEIRMITPNNDLIKSWTQVLKLRITNGYYFIYIEPLQAIVIPWRAFKNDTEKEEFERLLLEYLVKK
ncbi:MAG TPA: YcxB family protein [Bacteroidales bacterium]|nr:YcxB family protein [Bacteroidales bacterium]